MNWTGGSLQRTKIANKGVTQKQKAYFARARMHLQNGPTSPAAPFQPSYLRNDDRVERDTRASLFPSAVSASCDGSPERHVSPDDWQSEQGSDMHISRKSTRLRLRGSLKGVPRAVMEERDETLRNSRLGKRNRKSGFTDASLETQLLEENKKRLLKQRDWVGVAPSEPVNLPISSIKEDNRTGKRRMTGKNHVAAVAQRERTGNRYRNNLTGQTRIDGEEIRVRIGTDALTAHSTQPIEETHSQASSDLMLFDQENESTLQPREYSRIFSPLLPYKTASPKVDRRRFDLSDMPSCDSEVGLQEIATSRSADYGLVGLNTVDQDMAEYGAGNQGLRIVHTVEGIARPLDLIFSTPNHSTRSRNHFRSTDQELRVVEHASPDGNAEAHLEHAHQRSNVDDQPQSNETSAGAVSVDDGPWRAFLSIPDKSSSHSTALQSTETSVTHARNDWVDHKSWSQHATQGNRTPFSSSDVSASLPPLKRIGARPQGNSFEPAPAPMETMGVDERLWRAFVFGSDDDTAPESQHDDSANEPRLIKRGRPVSAGSDVVSHTLTSFYQTSTRATCASSKRADAPRSGSQAISSTASPYGDWGQVGELDERQDVVGEQSVTHASLQNNASCNSGVLPSSGRSSTRTSRDGLGRGDLEQAETRKRDAWHQDRLSSIYAAGSSDCGGLDIVNPDRLT